MNASSIVKIGAVIFIVFGCKRTEPVLESESSPLSKAEQVADIITNLPSWGSTWCGDADDKAQFSDIQFNEIELAAIQLQEYSAIELSDGLSLAVNDTSSTSKRFDVILSGLIIYRAIFALPTELPLEDVQEPSTLLRGIGKSLPDPYPMNWPLSFDSDGQVSDVACFPGPPNGGWSPLKNVLATLFWFSSEYLHRDIPSCLDRCDQYNSSIICQCDTACAYYGDCCVDYEWRCVEERSSTGNPFYENIPEANPGRRIPDR